MGRQWLILGILITLLCTTSCKENYYIESDFHGMWQVTSIDSYSTGVTTYPQGALYYMFQRSMIALCTKHLDIPGSMTRSIAHFDIVASDSIGMGDFRKHTTGEGSYVNQEEKEPVRSLNKYGIYDDYTIFHVQMSKQQLILTSDSARVVLRKY